jgi:hypothetical protein
MNINTENFTILVSDVINKNKITITIYKRKPYVNNEPWLQELDFIKFDDLFKADLSKFSQFITNLLIQNDIIKVNGNIGFLTASLLCRLL